MKTIELIDDPTPAECNQNLRTMLSAECEMMRKVPRPKGVRYDGIGDFVLQYGVDFEYQPLPSSYAIGEPQACFYNCLTGLARYRGMVYVEGYACHPEYPLPVHHAWLVRAGERKVIELTCGDFRGYVGVAFSRQGVSDHIHRVEKLSYPQNSMLDDFGNHFPVLTAGPMKLAKWLHPDYQPDEQVAGPVKRPVKRPGKFAKKV